MKQDSPQIHPPPRRNAAEAYSSAEEADEPVSPHSTLAFQIGLILLLLGAAGVYGWKSWRHYDPNNDVPARMGMGELDDPSPEWFEHRRRRLTETLETVNLDTDQWRQINLLLEGPVPSRREGWYGRIEQVRKVMTPQQLLLFEESLERERQMRSGRPPGYPREPAPETSPWREEPPLEESAPLKPEGPARLKHRG